MRRAAATLHIWRHLICTIAWYRYLWCIVDPIQDLKISLALNIQAACPKRCSNDFRQVQFFWTWPKMTLQYIILLFSCLKSFGSVQKKIRTGQKSFWISKRRGHRFSTWISYLERTLVHSRYRPDFGHVDGWAIFVPWHHHIMFNPFNNPIIRSILPPLSAYNSLFWAYAFTCFDDI